MDPKFEEFPTAVVMAYGCTNLPLQTMVYWDDGKENGNYRDHIGVI